MASTEEGNLYVDITELRMDQVSQKMSQINHQSIYIAIFDPTQYSTFSLLDLHHLLPQLAENGRDWDSPLLSNMLSQPQDLPGGEMRMSNIEMKHGKVISQTL